jgi:exopolysaccharide production protein ExoQ
MVRQTRHERRISLKQLPQRGSNRLHEDHAEEYMTSTYRTGLGDRMTRPIALKLYFLYVLGIASEVIANCFGKPEASALSGNIVHFALSMGLLAWTVVLAYPVYEGIRRVLMSCKLLLAMYLYAAISCFWSPNPMASVREILLLLTLLISAAYISLVFSPEDIIDLTAKVSAIFALASIVAQFVQNPIYSTVLGGWIGLYGHRNFFGVGLTIGVASLLASRSRWGFMRWCMLLLFLILLIVVQSATAIVISASVIGIYAFKRLPRLARLSLAFATTVATVLVVWTSDVNHVIQLFLGLINRDRTFTGRTDIWYFDSTQIMNRPLFGHGYVGFWGPHKDIVIANLGWNPGHAHNGFLNIILIFGIVGLFGLLAVLWDGVKCGLCRSGSSGSLAGNWLLLVIWLEFLNNMTEADYVGPTPLWTLFVIAYFSCSVVEIKPMPSRGENAGRAAFPDGTSVQEG